MVWGMKNLVKGLVALALVAFAAGCAPLPADSSEATSASSERAAVETTSRLQAETEAEDDPGTPERSIVPLEWDASTAQLVGRQGSAGLWGACGECAIANTLNLVTGSVCTEADIVDYTLEQGLCDPATGGMTLDDMADAYSGLLPLDRMDVHGYAGDYAPTIDEMATLLDAGIILNASVYGEMMREGGHTGEGDIHGTHWLVLHRADRAPDGTVAGFGIIDSASDTTYLSAQKLADVYYGHDGTTILDPACVEVYGWK